MEHPLRILVVDDEKAVRRFLRTSLEARGFQVLEAETGEECLEKVRTQRPGLVLLDLGLPDFTGIEVTRNLREWYQSPIIVLSVKDREKDKVQALDAGADDYLSKPFGLAELMARIRANLRRSLRTQEDSPQIQSGQLLLDLAARRVTLAGKPLSLTPTEYDLLKLLARHPGRVLTHQQILKEVWGHNQLDLHILRVNISNLRKKIEGNPTHPTSLITEPGVGYRFSTDS